MGKVKFLDAVAFLFVSIICIFIFTNIATLVSQENIELFSVSSPLIFAVLVGTVFVVSLIIVGYRELKAMKNNEKISSQATRELFSELKVVLIFTLVILVYIFLLKYLRFLIGTLVFMIAGMAILNVNKDKAVVKIGKAAVATLLTVPLMYYIFHEVFHVMLP